MKSLFKTILSNTPGSYKLYYKVNNGEPIRPDGMMFATNEVNGSNEGEMSFDQAITTIPDRAFIHRTTLTEITIPSNVTSIGVSAFARCSSLANVKLGLNVTYIGSDAFCLDENLETFQIDCITPPTINSNIFSGCSNLTQSTYHRNLLTHTKKHLDGLSMHH